MINTKENDSVEVTETEKIKIELENMKNRLYKIAENSGDTDVEYNLLTAYDRIHDAIEVIEREEIQFS